jgi:hypothetical protein
MRRPPTARAEAASLAGGGHGEQARGHFTTATTMYREMDVTYWLESVEAEMRQLELRRGGAHS